MKVIIQWSPEEEDSETLIMDKLWNFTTDNFGGEIPCVGDKMLLNLPIENPLGRYKPWQFKVVQRTWEPEQQEIQDQDLRNLPCEPLQVGARHALPLQRWCTKVENA
jgi:hypothetical protein